MKVSDHEYFDEISNYITHIKGCAETSKKLLLILQKQQHTVKESNFKFMVKEVRYELLELLESMGKNVSSQETKDDIEREAFMIGCETLTDELKIMAIREEWILQQKHMAEIQNLILQINRQLSLHTNHCLTQASVLMTIFAKVLEEEGVIEQFLDSTDLLEMLHTMGKNFQYFFSSHNVCKSTNDGHKFVFAICSIVVSISNNREGQQLLLNSCVDVIERFILSLPLINCRPAEKIKSLILELLLNLTKNKTSLAPITNLRRIFDYCLNEPHSNRKIVKAGLELLEQVIDNNDNSAGYNDLLNSIEDCVTSATLQSIGSENPNINETVQRVIGKLKDLNNRVKLDMQNSCISETSQSSACKKTTVAIADSVDTTYRQNISETKNLPDRLDVDCLYPTLSEHGTETDNYSDETFVICACSSPTPSKSDFSVNQSQLVETISKSFQTQQRCFDISTSFTCDNSREYNQPTQQDYNKSFQTQQNYQKSSILPVCDSNRENNQLVPQDYLGKEIVPYSCPYPCYLSSKQPVPKKSDTLHLPPRLMIRSTVNPISKDVHLKQRICTRIKLLKSEQD